jgi:tetratricopeptide (TPR) repeat protein
LDEGTPALEAARYAAFLSYSHKDSAQARWLHRRLETYRIPRRLVGTPGEHGPVPARLTPIFRDREELPAAGDLSERIRAALAASRSLIVLCSPNSAASPWVAKEIETFRQLHPGRPVYAAIVEGDPAECFPGALAEGGAEPLAGDLRQSRDGRRLGLLKLVAGLAGVPLDSLVQRDAARRIRRVTAVTVAALAAMLVMAVMTALALNARREAQHQRAEAEGLVEFMLTDLRDRLKTVGRLDVLAVVNRRALVYYSGQRNLRDLPEDSVGRRARVLHAMGEDDLTSGAYRYALERFGEAHAATATIVSRHPSDPAAIFAHGQSEYWLGYAHQLEGDWGSAQRRYERYSDAARKLMKIDPDNPDYMLEMAWAASNRGVVQRDGVKDPVAAQSLFEDAIHWFGQAIAARPRDSDRRDLANAYGDLADTYHVRHLWTAALRARLEAHRIVESLTRVQPRNLELAYRLTISERAIAAEYARVGAIQAARPIMLRAYVRARSLTESDPSNADWRLLRAKIECDFLNRSLRLLPPSETAVRRSLFSSIDALRRQHNPRIVEIQSCGRTAV